MANENNKVNDLINELLVVGSFFKKPDLYVEYGEVVRSKYDFSDENIKFLYDCFELCYKTFSPEINESKFNTFMYMDNDRKKRYIELGSWRTIQKQIDLADVDDFKNYFNKLKKYSLLREFGNKGFPTEKIINYKNFNKMSAEDIVTVMRRNVDHIHTVIGGGEESIILGKDMTKSIDQWRETPSMGIELPFPILTYLFRGWRKKKLIIDGMLSNDGKSRRMSMVAAYIGVLKRKNCLILVNEMEEEEIKAAMLSAICNNNHFGFNLNIPERKIVLGEYDNEEQYESVKKVGKWVEENTCIRFMELNDYSDQKITNEVKKHALGYQTEYLFYDTLKGHGGDSWELVKQTATLIKDLCNEMNIGGYATIQLTDDSVNFDIHDLTSMNIANSKQLKHITDHLTFEKRIEKYKYDKYVIVNDDWGEFPLDNNKLYYGLKVDKNRAGSKGSVIAYECNLDENTWNEVGFLKRK
jgi:replicative DNA helicase